MRRALAMVLAAAAFCAQAQPDPAVDTLRLQEDPAPLYRNPGMGWVFYTTALENLSDGERARGSLCYARFDWRTLEPSEGAFDWKPVDTEIAKARAMGMKYAFGVMNVSSDFGPADGYCVPKWVFEAGARSYRAKDTRGITNIIPYWTDNPVFLAKLAAFAKALGARYDGNADLAYVDIRSYGNWGEGHLGFINRSESGETIPEPANARLQADYFQPYMTAFPRTQLIVPFGHFGFDTAYAWCVSKGLGMRRDGLPNWSDGKDIARAQGSAPTAVEYTDGFQNMIRAGTWDDAKVAQAVLNAHASYAEISRGGAKQFLTDEAPLMGGLANRLGYHFVLKQAVLPAPGIGQGARFPVSMRWENQGTTYLYREACSVALALLDRNDGVVESCILSGVDPKTWGPGLHDVTAQAVFPTAANGIYKLAVGLLRDPGSLFPEYRIGNLGRTPSGWYVLTDSLVVFKSLSVAPAAPAAPAKRRSKGVWAELKKSASDLLGRAGVHHFSW